MQSEEMQYTFRVQQHDVEPAHSKQIDAWKGTKPGPELSSTVKVLQGGQTKMDYDYWRLMEERTCTWTCTCDKHKSRDRYREIERNE